MTVSVTLNVPPSVYRLAQRTATATARPVEQVLVDIIAAASPVADDLPPELQAEVEALADTTDEALWEVARSTFPVDRRRIYERLLEKDNTGVITPVERDELKALRFESERLMLRKAHAYALLKWRGHILPSLRDLPRPQ